MKNKLSRSETISIRLDPKLKYLAELAARKQRKTLSSFIEWCVDDKLRTEIIYGELTFMDRINTLFDSDSDIRLKILKSNHPELLTYDEEIYLSTIIEKE